MAKKLAVAKKQIIAAGKVAGKKHAVIAREARVSVSTVDHAHQDTETRAYMEEFSAASAEHLREAFRIACEKLKEDVANPDPQVRSFARRDLLSYVQGADKGRGLERGVGAKDGQGEFLLADLMKIFVRDVE